MLCRYWFTFEPEPGRTLPFGLGLGCGVTAHDRSDAEVLISERVFRGSELPPVGMVVENVDVSTLDEGHVLPNIGDVTRRGIWFPLGFGATA